MRPASPQAPPISWNYAGVFLKKSEKAAMQRGHEAALARFGLAHGAASGAT